jgi:hypothetical protein
VLGGTLVLAQRDHNRARSEEDRCPSSHQHSRSRWPALFVALSGTGIAGVGAKQKTVRVLGPTQVYVHSFPPQAPHGAVKCPGGYEAVGGGYASRQWPHYQVDLEGPARGGFDYRSSDEGANSAANTWYVTAQHTGTGDAPHNAVVICAKVLPIKVQP